MAQAHTDGYKWSAASDVNARLRKQIKTLPVEPSDFKFDICAVWSITNSRIAYEICIAAKRIFNCDSSASVFDAMASVGGNTIPFLDHFDSVTAVEADAARYQMLIHNVSLMSADNTTNTTNTTKRRFTSHEGFCQDYFTPHTIGFFDPPWGLNYKKTRSIKLSVQTKYGEQSLEDMLNTTYDIFDHIIVKLPVNYNMSHFHNHVKMEIVHELRYNRPNSSLFVFLTKK